METVITFSVNYYNQLVDHCNYKEENFKNSLKYNKFGLKFNTILNSWRYEGIDFTIISGFDYKSNDKLVSSFRKITLGIDKRNFNRINKNEGTFKLDYDEKNEKLIIVI